MNSRRWMVAVGVGLALWAGCGWAGNALWNQTAASTTYDWTNSANWLPATGFPNGAGEVASLTNDIVGNQTIRLGQNIQIGSLYIGDSALTTTNTFTIGANGSSNRLQMRAATNNGTAYITVMDFPGTAGHAFNAVVDMQPSASLSIWAGNSQTLGFSSGIATNNGLITVSGGPATITINGDLVGSGQVVKTSQGNLSLSNAKSYTGSFTINRGTLELGSSGAIRTANTVTVNGYYIYTGGSTVAQTGGVFNAGNNASSPSNPGQRFPTNTIIINGGSVSASGQLGNGTWNTETVSDTVARVRFNSGYGNVYIATGGQTTGTVFDVVQMERTNSATVYTRCTTYLTVGKWTVHNITNYLRGAGGAPGQVDMSIIPWIAARNDATGTATPDGFATYASNTVRALVAAEYTNSITAGSTYNVSVGTVSALAADTTVNALKLTASPSSIGAGRRLTVTSGAIILSGILGTPGSNTAGTLNFGSAEGVLWGGISGTNVIGAVIDGSGGLTKTSIAAVTLTATNTYTGTTSVNCGTLMVGNDTYGSNLGAGDVFVADGARLLIRAASTNAIANTATVRLSHFGDFYGVMELDPGVNETVYGLELGGVKQPSGTYGSSSSSATFKRDSYFAGSGILTVPPSKQIGFMLIFR